MSQGREPGGGRRFPSLRVPLMMGRRWTSTQGHRLQFFAGTPRWARVAGMVPFNSQP